MEGSRHLLLPLRRFITSRVWRCTETRWWPASTTRPSAKSVIAPNAPHMMREGSADSLNGCTPIGRTPVRLGSALRRPGPVSFLEGAGRGRVGHGPGSIPRRSGDRIKTDRRDAPTRAEYGAAGRWTECFGPDPQGESTRHLAARVEDRSRPRTLRLLRSRGPVYPRAGPGWRSPCAESMRGH